MAQESDLSLFRGSALEAASSASDVIGKPTGVVPPTWTKITLTVGLFLVSVAVFVFTMDFSRAETVRGILKPSEGEARLYPPSNGFVGRIETYEGAVVEKGTELLYVESERFMSDGATISSETIAVLDQQIATLGERVITINSIAELSILDAEERIEATEETLTGLYNQMEILSERREIARTRSKNGESFLEEGLIAEPDYNERRDALASIEQQITQLEIRITEAKSGQRRAEIEIQSIKAGLERELLDIAQSKSRLESERNNVLSSSGYGVIAPIDGVVTALQVKPGEAVNSNRPVATITPKEQTLFALLYVPSRAVAFIEPGKEVKLKYDAFPFQKFGVSSGVVESLSSTSFQPRELGFNSNSEEPLYLLTVALENQTIQAFGEDVELQSGMSLSAEIILEDRKIIEWLMEPLLSAT